MHWKEVKMRTLSDFKVIISNLTSIYWSESRNVW